MRQTPGHPNNREPNGPGEDVFLDRVRTEEEVDDEEGRGEGSPTEGV